MKSTDKATSMRQFQRRFRTEASCRGHLYRLRWPDGFTCPICGHRHCYGLPRRNLYQCKSCRYQASVTAGTVMHRTRTPLRVWFWAIYLMSNDKRGLSALQLSKKLEVSYYVAWTMLHKIRRAMKERDSQQGLSGIVQVNKAVLSGGPGGDKRGRGSSKTSVIVRVLASPGSVKCGQMRVSNGSKNRRSEEDSVARSAGSQANLSQYGAEELIAVHSDAETNQIKGDSPKGWLQIVVSNLKSFLLGTFHGIGKKHLQKYVDEFCYRFNRRDLDLELFGRLLIACANSKGVTYSELTR